MEQVASLIAQNLKIMVKSRDRRPLQSKRKAITALLPYAIWQERDGQPEMFDTFIHVARTPKDWGFTWHHVGQYVSGLLHEASPRAIVLVLPHIQRNWLTDGGDLIQRWVAAVSAVPPTKGVSQSIIDTLLQIASKEKLLPYIPINIWSWLTKRPPLPPICLGRTAGTLPHVVKAVRALKDIEVLKSYFLLVWSEWGISGRPSFSASYPFDGFADMQISIQEDFGGIGMGHHRADLLRHLDHVLGELDRGLKYLKQHNPEFNEDHLRGMKHQYRNLREALLRTIRRKSNSTITSLCMLTPTLDAHRITRNVYVHTPSPVPVVSRLEHSVPPAPYFVRTSTSISPADSCV